jgi:hypothetical protein
MHNKQNDPLNLEIGLIEDREILHNKYCNGTNLIRLSILFTILSCIIVLIYYLIYLIKI